MLATLSPKSARRYLSLPLFGPVIDDFDRWLSEQGYALGSRHNQLVIVAQLDSYLRRRGVRCIQELTPAVFDRCWRVFHRRFLNLAGAVHVLERFLERQRLFRLSPIPVPSPINLQLQAYSNYLREVRGCSQSTLQSHLRTATRFLTFFRVDENPSVLAHVQIGHLEGFVRKESKGVSRGTLQHTIAALRGLLRFLRSLVRSLLAWRPKSTLRSFIKRNDSQALCLGRRFGLSSNRFPGRLRWVAATMPCFSSLPLTAYALVKWWP